MFHKRNICHTWFHFPIVSMAYCIEWKLVEFARYRKYFIFNFHLFGLSSDEKTWLTQHTTTFWIFVFGFVNYCSDIWYIQIQFTDIWTFSTHFISLRIFIDFFFHNILDLDSNWIVLHEFFSHWWNDEKNIENTVRISDS